MLTSGSSIPGLAEHLGHQVLVVEVDTRPQNNITPGAS
jgi:hypothetical protein